MLRDHHFYHHGHIIWLVKDIFRRRALLYETCLFFCFSVCLSHVCLSTCLSVFLSISIYFFLNIAHLPPIFNNRRFILIAQLCFIKTSMLYYPFLWMVIVLFSLLLCFFCFAVVLFTVANAKLCMKETSIGLRSEKISCRCYS